jgi:hypothetical protein
MLHVKKSYSIGAIRLQYLQARPDCNLSPSAKLRSRWLVWTGIAVRIGRSADLAGPAPAALVRTLAP